MSKTTLPTHRPSAGSPKTTDRSWYAFRNATESEVEIFLYDEIGFWGTGAKEFIGELRQHAGKHVHLRINSPGGEVHAGYAIFNALKRHHGGVTVHIDGMAASMASVIALAGQTINIANNAFMFVHEPWSVVSGPAKTMRKAADELERISEVLVASYAARTKKPTSEIENMMAEETLLGATEAVVECSRSLSQLL